MMDNGRRWWQIAAAILAGLLAGAVLVNIAVRGETCTVIPETVNSHATEEVSEELQALFDSTPDGGCIDFPRPTNRDPAKFLVNGDPGPWEHREHVVSLSLAERRDLTINGNGSWLVVDRHSNNYPGGRTMLNLDGSSGITSLGLSFDGIHTVDPTRNNCLESEDFDGDGVPDYEFNRAVTLGSATGATFAPGLNAPFRITDHPGSGLSSAPGNTLTDLSVTGGRFECFGDHAIVTGGNVVGASVVENSFHRSGRNMLNFEPRGCCAVVDGADILDNTFGRSGIGHISMSNTQAKRNVVIRGNVFTEPVDPFRLRVGSNPNNYNIVIEDNIGIGVIGDSPIGIGRGSLVRINGNVQDTTAEVAIGLTAPTWNPGGCGNFGCSEPGWTCRVTDVSAADNTFAGAQQLYPVVAYDPAAQPDPYAACGWVDAGGNEP